MAGMTFLTKPPEINSRYKEAIKQDFLESLRWTRPEVFPNRRRGRRSSSVNRRGSVSRSRTRGSSVTASGGSANPSSLRRTSTSGSDSPGALRRKSISERRGSTRSRGASNGSSGGGDSFHRRSSEDSTGSNLSMGSFHSSSGGSSFQSGEGSFQRDRAGSAGKKGSTLSPRRNSLQNTPPKRRGSNGTSSFTRGNSMGPSTNVTDSFQGPQGRHMRVGSSPMIMEDTEAELRSGGLARTSSVAAHLTPPNSLEVKPALANQPETLREESTSHRTRRASVTAVTAKELQAARGGGGCCTVS